MSSETTPVKNELLAALPRAASVRLPPRMESVSPLLGAGLYNSGQSIEQPHGRRSSYILSF